MAICLKVNIGRWCILDSRDVYRSILQVKINSIGSNSTILDGSGTMVKLIVLVERSTAAASTVEGFHSN
jgi:hypothetical protein